MQNMTVSLERVAHAFGKNKEQFVALVPALEALGFPKSNSSEGEIEICRLLDWLVSQQESNLAIAALIAEEIGEKRE